MRNEGTALAVAMAALITLAGCGGGGGGSGAGGTPSGGGTETEPPSSGLSLLEKWRRFENGSPTLSMTDAEVRQELRTAWEGMTHIIDVDAADAIPVELLGDSTSYSELLDQLFSAVTAALPVMAHDGVRVAETRERDEYGESLLRYSGWLEHTSFWVTDYGDGAYGLSGGHYPGTNPTGSGSATWNGVMVGKEIVETGPGSGLQYGDVYLGDARVTIDNFASPDADVAFTNIVNATDGTSRSDISWNDLTIEDGLFTSSVSQYGNYIIGSFNGPRHQESGGSCAKDGITGAFGAKRE